MTLLTNREVVRRICSSKWVGRVPENSGVYDYLKIQPQLFLFNSYRYEDEINKRTAAENEFVTLKKVRAVCEVPGACRCRFLAALEEISLFHCYGATKFRQLEKKRERNQVHLSLERSLSDSVHLFLVFE